MDWSNTNVLFYSSFVFVWTSMCTLFCVLESVLIDVSRRLYVECHLGNADVNWDSSRCRFHETLHPVRSLEKSQVLLSVRETLVSWLNLQFYLWIYMLFIAWFCRLWGIVLSQKGRELQTIYPLALASAIRANVSLSCSSEFCAVKPVLPFN